MPADDQRETEHPFTVAYANDIDEIEDAPFAIATTLGLPSRRITPRIIGAAQLGDDLKRSIFNPYGISSSFRSVVDIAEDAPGVNLVLLSRNVGLMPFSYTPPFPYIVYIAHEFMVNPSGSERLQLHILRQEHFRAGVSAASDLITFRKGPFHVPGPAGSEPFAATPFPNEASEQAARILIDNIPELSFERGRYRGIKLCSEIRDKLEELGQHLASSQPISVRGSRHGIGGNNPPEPIAEDFRALLSGSPEQRSKSPQQILNTGLDAVDQVYSPLKEPVADRQKLARIVDMLLTCAEVFSKSFFEKLGSISAVGVSAYVASRWIEIGDLFKALGEIVQKLIGAF